VTLTLAPWDEHCFDVLERCNTPEMTAHLGGPETDEALRDRQDRYLGYVRESITAWPLQIQVDGEAIGSMSFWQVGENEYELGWAVVPERQGNGYATAAVAAVLELARDNSQFGRFHASPGVNNAASNAVARKAGFTLVRQHEIEYPPGQHMLANDWVLTLDER
jgi:RimJ/RimL family protein N-acetyltransferase